MEKQKPKTKANPERQRQRFPKEPKLEALGLLDPKAHGMVLVGKDY